MSKQTSFRQQSRRMALCGLMAALATVVMLLGGLIPMATFACPMLAMICLLPIVCEYGPKHALLAYAAVSLIVLIGAPDKELAAFFVALGYYPALRPFLQRIRSKMVRLLAKCGIFSGAMVVMYALLIFLFRLEALVEEFSTYSMGLLILLLALGNLTFLFFDFAMGLLIIIYQKRLRRLLFRS